MDELYASCRICLGAEAEIPIFLTETNYEHDLLQKLNLCLGAKVEDIPGYPRNICKNCFTTVNATVRFVDNYRQSCQILEQRLTVLAQEENMELEKKVKDEPEYEIIYEEDFVGFDTIEIMKPESKIIFSDSHQLEQLIKPLLKKDEKEISRPKKSKAKLETTIVTNKKIKKITKKCENKNVKFSNKSIASSILEGDFVFMGDKWGLKPLKNLYEKDINKSADTCERNISKPDEKEIMNKIKDKTPAAPRLCEFCGKTYPSQEALRSHTLIHFGVSVTCPICSKILKNSRALKLHNKMIHGKRDFICSVCGMGFALQYLLNNHKMTHTIGYARKKYECKICGKQYSNEVVLLIHTRSIHTGERPEVCNVCGASFFHKVYLKEHIRLHTGETPFKCPVCDRGYAQLGNLKSHIKHRHKLSQLSGSQLKTIPQRFLRFMKP